jgi:hypothetical protein
MTTRLSDDLRKAVEQQGGAPVYVVDSVTNATYVLMRAEQFEKLRAVLDVDDVEGMYPLIASVEPDDWEDISNYDRQP